LPDKTGLPGVWRIYPCKPELLAADFQRLAVNDPGRAGDIGGHCLPGRNGKDQNKHNSQHRNIENENLCSRPLITG